MAALEETNEWGHDAALLARARKLHDPPNATFDGHNDLPWTLHEAYGSRRGYVSDGSRRRRGRDVDIPWRRDAETGRSGPLNTRAGPRPAPRNIHAAPRGGAATRHLRRHRTLAMRDRPLGISTRHPAAGPRPAPDGGTMTRKRHCLRYEHRLARVDLREPQEKVYCPQIRHRFLHTDFPRVRKGGLTAQFWSVYVPTTIRGDLAVQKTLEQIDVVHRLCEEYPDELEFAWSAADVRRIVAAGKLASMCGVEGGHQINGSLATLRMYHRLGVRYMTLTHNGGPGWADAALDDGGKYNEHATAGGLSKFGEIVVKEMNRVGMAVDIAHVHADTMRKAIEISEASCAERDIHRRPRRPIPLPAGPSSSRIPTRGRSATTPGTCPTTC